MDLVEAIDAVMIDTKWFSRKVVERPANARHGRSGNAPRAEIDALSHREREVLELICEGFANAWIAATLRLSRHTIRNYVAALYRKIRVARRSAAVGWGRERV